jgi:hypothetical protein
VDPTGLVSQFQLYFVGEVFFIHPPGEPLDYQDEMAVNRFGSTELAKYVATTFRSYYYRSGFEFGYTIIPRPEFGTNQSIYYLSLAFRMPNGCNSCKYELTSDQLVIYRERVIYRNKTCNSTAAAALAAPPDGLSDQEEEVPSLSTGAPTQQSIGTKSPTSAGPLMGSNVSYHDKTNTTEHSPCPAQTDFNGSEVPFGFAVLVAAAGIPLALLWVHCTRSRAPRPDPQVTVEMAPV